MDAKAVANLIQIRHSLSVAEADVLDARAWLQEERKLNETPPVTEKKTENTTPVTPPANTPATPPANSENQAGDVVGDKAGAVSAASPASVPASPPTANMELKIPAGVSETPPIPVIDDLIQRGYRSRDDLEAFMKENFKGKAYREEVRERLQLFKARQPPFNDIPATPPSTPPVTPPTIPPSNPPATTPPSGGNPPNTAVSPGPGGMDGNVAGSVVGSVAGGVPAAPKQSTELSEEQLISSLDARQKGGIT